MKTISLVLGLIFCYSINGFCQKSAPNPKKISGPINNQVNPDHTNTYIVEYNFGKGRYEINNLKIKVGTPVSYKISNINRLAYIIGVSSKDTIIAETNLSSLPLTASDFSTLVPKSKFNSILGTNPASEVETITSNEMSNEVKNAKAKEGKATVSSVTEDLSTISKSTQLAEQISALQSQNSFLQSEAKWITDSVNLYMSKQSALVTMISAADSSLKIQLAKQKVLIDSRLLMLNAKSLLAKTSLTNLSEKEKSLEANYIKIESLKNDALAKFKVDNDRFVAAFERLKYGYFNARKAVQFYKDIKVIVDNPVFSSTMYESKYKLGFDTMKTQIPYLKNESIRFENTYTDLESLYNNLTSNPTLSEVLNYGGRVKLYANSNNLKTVADRMHALVKEMNVLKLLDRTQQILDFLSMPDAFSITFGPIQPLNDAVVFDVKIDKREGNESELYNNLHFKHTEYTYGGTRLDFSLGLAGSYFKNTPVYELSSKKVPNSDASIVSIAQKSNQLFVPSLVGMATMSVRSSGYVALGGSAGLGIDVANGKIQLSNFYMGPSAIFGKYERVTLTTGATVRNVGQLSASYKKDDVVQGTSDKISNFMSDKYKVGFFVSLSVNLTKGIKDNIKQIKSPL